MFTDICTLLKNAGLDSSYWFNILHEQFQTTAVQDIQALDEGTLQAIADCAREPKDINVMFQFLISLNPINQTVEQREVEEKTLEPVDIKETSSSEPFRIFLKQAKLYDYFPGKLSIQDIMKVKNEVSNENNDDNVNVISFLKRLIMLDNTARNSFETAIKGSEKVTCGLTGMVGHNVSDSSDKSHDSDESGEDHDSDDSDDSGDAEDSDDSEPGSTDENNEIYPLDYFLAAYLCCDHILRQAFIQKLFFCRLAIPILYPSFNGKHMEMLLWPLRSIVPEWRTNDGKLVEKDAVSTPCHLVSFCRVGKSERYSKSKLINEIISDVAHATFFHWDCPGGNRKRQISEGMIEGTWYIPRGTESDILPDLTIILNLRGDSLNHETQFDMLSMISSVIVLVVDTRCLCKTKSSAANLRSLLEETQAV